MKSFPDVKNQTGKVLYNFGKGISIRKRPVIRQVAERWSVEKSASEKRGAPTHFIFRFFKSPGLTY